MICHACLAFQIGASQIRTLHVNQTMQYTGVAIFVFRSTNHVSITVRAIDLQNSKLSQHKQTIESNLEDCVAFILARISTILFNFTVCVIYAMSVCLPILQYLTQRKEISKIM